jgi:hypothetical protein
MQAAPLGYFDMDHSHPNQIKRATLPTWQLLSLLAVALLLNLARAPKEIVHGQVYAEEGTTYLKYAWNANPLGALLAPHMGYYSLFNNVITVVAARILPLSMAAYLFVWCALAVRMLAAYLVITSEYLQDFRGRLFTMLAFLLAAGSLEGWLSLEYSQFCFPICVALILVSSEQRWKSFQSRFFKIAILVIAGLTGVTSCVLLPLFWVKVLLTKTRQALFEAGTLSLMTGIQAAFVIESIRTGDKHGFDSHFRYAGPILLQRALLLPFFTGRIVLYSNHLFAAHPSIFIPLAWLLLILGFLSLMSLPRQGAKVPVYLLAAAALSAAVNWVGCADCGGSGLFTVSPIAASRYFYTADALICLSVSFMFLQSTDGLNRYLTGGLLGLVLLSGGIQYPREIGQLGNARAEWGPQVAAWQKDATTPINIPPSYWDIALFLPHEHTNYQLPVWIYDSTRQKERVEIREDCRRRYGVDAQGILHSAHGDVNCRYVCSRGAQ